MGEHSSLVDRIVADLQHQIVEEKLGPDERLPSERKLCAAYSVGRTTIREALKSLVVQGLVTRRGRRVVVTDPETRPGPRVDLESLAARVSIRELYDVRKLIEVRVAGWAATRATPADIEEIRRTVEADTIGQEGVINPNRAFHDALVEAAHNPVLRQIYESGRSFFFRLPFFWRLFDDEEVRTTRGRRHELALRWHRHILRAIEQHDPEEAEGAMFQHLDIMEKDLLARLQTSNSHAVENSVHPHPMLADLYVNQHSKLK